MAKDFEPMVNVTHIGTVDVSAAVHRNIFIAPCACVLKRVAIINGTAKAKDKDNNLTATVKNLGSAGTGTTTVATQSTDSDVTGSVAISADIPWELKLSTTLANLELADGDVLQLQFTEGAAGAGDLDAEAAVIVEWVPGNGPGK